MNIYILEAGISMNMDTCLENVQKKPNNPVEKQGGQRFRSLHQGVWEEKNDKKKSSPGGK